MKTEETHPWKWFIPEGSRSLIIGTFPTAKRNWRYDFFYPNPSNLFWKVISNISGNELSYFSGDEAVTERKEILNKLLLGITDMGKRVIRDDNSSSDEKLSPIEYMDILKIIEDNPSIRKIILTSSSGKVCATKWFSNYLMQQNIFIKSMKDPKPIVNEVYINGKQIKIVTLYSTSMRAANRITLERLIALYKNEII